MAVAQTTKILSIAIFVGILLSACSNQPIIDSCPGMNSKKELAQIGDVIIAVPRGIVRSHIPRNDDCKKTWLIRTSEVVTLVSIKRSSSMFTPEFERIYNQNSTIGVVLETPNKFRLIKPGVSLISQIYGRDFAAFCHGARSSKDQSYCNVYIELTPMTSLRTAINMNNDVSEPSVQAAVKSVIDGVDAIRIDQRPKHT